MAVDSSRLSITAPRGPARPSRASERRPRAPGGGAELVPPQRCARSAEAAATRSISCGTRTSSRSSWRRSCARQVAEEPLRCVELREEAEVLERAGSPRDRARLRRRARGTTSARSCSSISRGPRCDAWSSAAGRSRCSSCFRCAPRRRGAPVHGAPADRPPRRQARQHHHGRAPAPHRPQHRALARACARARSSPIGTDAYMPPEQCLPADHPGLIGPASDLWGLGATLHHAVSGEVPFPRPKGAGDHDDPAVRFPQLERPARPLPDRIPADLRDLIRSLAEKDREGAPPRRRWRSGWSRWWPSCRASYARRWAPGALVRELSSCARGPLTLPGIRKRHDPAITRRI